MPPLPTQEENFDSATEKFDLDELKTAMEADKQGKISEAPWRYFKGVLCGYSTTDVARICGVQPKTVSVALNRGIKDHLWQVLQRSEDENLGDWKDAVGWLRGTKFDLLQKCPTDWQRVCREMWQKQKEKQRIRQEVTEKGFELNVHVGLGLVQREQQQRRQGNELDRSQIYDLTDREAIVRRFEHGEFLAEVIEQPPKVNKHVAIIGEPGAGKTTLLAAIADRLSHYNSKKLPICISLAGLQKKPLQDYLLQTWLPEAFHLVYTDVALDETHRIAFQNWLRQGEVWLLLDGVDEMGEEYPATALNTIKMQLIDWLGNVRVALTCRSNVWDAQLNNPLSGTFDIYKTQEFKPEQIEQFIQQWFSQSKKPERGQVLQQKLNEPQRERVRELVRNPLRLSLLCQAFYNNLNEDLPQTKAGLYETFVRDFYKWKTEQHQTKEPQCEKLNKALGKLALGGLDNEHGLHRFRLPEKAARKIMGHKQFELAEKLGWLNIVDQDADSPQAVYAFFHPTFQEYFAALAIDDWDDFLPRNHENKPVQNRKDECRYRIFAQHWEEAIILWFGRSEIDCVQKRLLAAKVANFTDDCGKFYWHQARFLATLFTSEFQSFPQAQTILGDAVDLIINRGISTYDREDKIYIINGYLAEQAAEFLRRANPKMVATTLLNRLYDQVEINDFIKLTLIRIYVDVFPEISDLKSILEKLLNSTETGVKENCAEILLKNDHNHFKAKDVKTKFENSLKDVSKLFNVADILQSFSSFGDKFRASSHQVEKIQDVDTLIEQLEWSLANDNSFTFMATTKRLGKSQVGNKRVVGKLLNLIADNHDAIFMEQQVISCLVKIINQNLFSYVTQVLKKHLLTKAYNLNKISADQDSTKEFDQYKLFYKVTWHCAQNMSYPEFYAAWHNPLSTTDSAAIADRPS